VQRERMTRLIIGVLERLAAAAGPPLTLMDFTPDELAQPGFGGFILLSTHADNAVSAGFARGYGGLPVAVVVGDEGDQGEDRDEQDGEGEEDVCLD
jgi:hypothetical protein